MKHKVEAECSSCSGTGVYCGFMEPKGTGVICLDCNGTGKEIIYYTPFQKRKERKKISTIKLSCHLANSLGIDLLYRKNVPYKEFKKALTEKEIKKLVRKYNKS